MGWDGTTLTHEPFKRMGWITYLTSLQDGMQLLVCLQIYMQLSTSLTCNLYQCINSIKSVSALDKRNICEYI